jgi:ligand-binding SRPBCC domain-containing protein
MPRFESSIVISRPAAVVFAFLVRPENLARISPGDSLTFVEAPDEIELGSVLAFELGGFGPVQKVVHEISEFEPPRRYVEKLVSGPLPQFVHEHLVEPQGADGTLVTDRIDFEPPGGFIGLLVNEAKIMESFRAAFGHRHRSMKALLEQGP